MWLLPLGDDTVSMLVVLNSRMRQYLRNVGSTTHKDMEPLPRSWNHSIEKVFFIEMWIEC